MNRSIDYYLIYHKRKIKFTVNVLNKEYSFGYKKSTFYKEVTIDNDIELGVKLDELLNEYESKLNKVSGN